MNRCVPIVLACFICFAVLADEPNQPQPRKEGSNLSEAAVPCRLDAKLPEINFAGNDLVDVIDFLRDVSGTNIFVNWKALERGKITKETKVDCKLKEVKFAKALQTILDSVSTKETKLSYVIDEGIIVISTVEDLDGTAITTKTYNIQFTLNAADEATNKKHKAALIKMITGTIAPRSWKHTEEGFEQIVEKDGQWVITQTEGAHRAIANLFEQLKVMMK